MSKPDDQFLYEEFYFNPAVDDFNEVVKNAIKLRDSALKYEREKNLEIEFYKSEDEIANDDRRIAASIAFFYQEFEGQKINQKIRIRNNPPIQGSQEIDACSAILPYREKISGEVEEEEKLVEIKTVIFRDTKNGKELDPLKVTVGFADSKLLKSHTKLCDDILELSENRVISLTTNPGTYQFLSSLKGKNITIHRSFTKNLQDATHASNNCGSRFLGVIAPIDAYLNLTELIKNNLRPDFEVIRTPKFGVFEVKSLQPSTGITPTRSSQLSFKTNLLEQETSNKETSNKTR
ncbi:MAG: hypothetical protein SFV53_04490 [Rickettsiales bacterium]|nr:hypothetical protein [Rickettsiales bacterium]